VSLSVVLLAVLLAMYALSSALLAMCVELAWRLGAWRDSRASLTLLAARLLPSIGAAFLVSGIFAPAFLLYEPVRTSEGGGPVLIALAVFALLLLCDGIRRGSFAWLQTRSLLKRCRTTDRIAGSAEPPVEIVDSFDSLVAVIGAWRPRIIASRRVVLACEQLEFEQVISHEAAHLQARDNLKLLLQVMGPDPLAWLPSGRALSERWRNAAELEADARATGGDPAKRIALASALVKVARLSAGDNPLRGALSVQVAADGIHDRVRELLAPQPAPRRAVHGVDVFAWMALTVVAAVPLYSFIHEFMELLVAIGR
jgi:hypothetical protein